MTDHQQIREALELSLKRTDLKYEHPFIKQALAALSRLEAAAAAEYERGRQDGMKQEHALWQMQRIGQEIEAAAVPELSREDVLGDEPDFDECIRQAEIATGLKVERNTASIVIREVRRWLAQKRAQAPRLSRDDVARLARQVGIQTGEPPEKAHVGLYLALNLLERFASLVRSVPVGGQS